MKSNNFTQSYRYFFGMLTLGTFLVSCGSFQYAGYEDDAIYDSNENKNYVERAPQQETEEQTEEQNGYYTNYFKEKVIEYSQANANDEDVIFTDVDSYSSTNVGVDGTQANQSFGGWGEDHNDEVIVNIYGSAYNTIWWNRPWGWNPGWNIGLNWWNSGWGWNIGWGWGWNDPWLWNSGWGWGIGWYNPWYCGYGWGGINNVYYGGRGVAYTNSRRGLAYNTVNTRSSINRRSGVNSSNTNISRRIQNPNARRVSSRGTVSRNSRGNTVTRGGSTIQRPSTARNGSSRSNPNVRRSTTRSRPSSMNTRPSSPSNRNFGNSRPSSSSRSSGMRSGGSSRSSGGMRSSGGRRGGRG